MAIEHCDQSSTHLELAQRPLRLLKIGGVEPLGDLSVDLGAEVLSVFRNGRGSAGGTSWGGSGAGGVQFDAGPRALAPMLAPTRGDSGQNVSIPDHSNRFKATNEKARKSFFRKDFRAKGSKNFGAGNRTRTGDIHLGKVANLACKP